MLGLIQLESIPYQSASVHEALRVAMLVPNRFPRIASSEGHNRLIVDSKVNSPGTISGVKMSGLTV
ncbi:hypothetical protein BELL_1705g00020 [Botrytis elliptica]|uniref:Uncharacterized protein n=1 Tax=Botrytis elliptica TaxID=278938 RepID=A0A4Z1I517_9HELO|nr:hypothetical protein BELL_1705g00020 [Botrytis elliptica]